MRHQYLNVKVGLLIPHEGKKVGSSHQHKETTGKLYVLIILSQNKVYNLACLFQKKIILNGLHFKCQIQMVYIMYISMSPIMHNGLAKIKKEQQALILH